MQSIRAAAAAVEPYFGKLTPAQMDQVIATIALLSQRQTASERLGMLVLAGAALFALAAICFLWTISLYYNEPALVSDLIKMLGGLLGGLLGGYGLRGAVERKSKGKPVP